MKTLFFNSRPPKKTKVNDKSDARIIIDKTLLKDFFIKIYFVKNRAECESFDLSYFYINNKSGSELDSEQ